jgi:hypothetical protein
MAFKKGDPKPPGSGRTKGTPNKPKPYALFLQEFMEADKELFMQDFMKLDEKDRCQVRSAIYKYVAPALSSMDVNANVSGDSALDKIKKMADED